MYLADALSFLNQPLEHGVESAFLMLDVVLQEMNQVQRKTLPGPIPRLRRQRLLQARQKSTNPLMLIAHLPGRAFALQKTSQHGKHFRLLPVQLAKNSQAQLLSPVSPGFSRLRETPQLFKFLQPGCILISDVLQTSGSRRRGKVNPQKPRWSLDQVTEDPLHPILWEGRFGENQYGFCMRQFCQTLCQLCNWWKILTNFPMVTKSQHCVRFGAAFVATLLLGGAVSPAFDWSEDALWELRNQDGQALYRLDTTMEELGVASNGQEMFILPAGLLIRQRNNRAVNLTVLKGDWAMLRDGKVIGKVGQTWEAWRTQVGDPLTIFVNPQKVGVIYFYRASLLDLGLMVAEGKVLSVMFMEPGYMRSALERSGYSPQP